MLLGDPWTHHVRWGTIPRALVVVLCTHAVGCQAPTTASRKPTEDPTPARRSETSRADSEAARVRGSIPSEIAANLATLSVRVSLSPPPGPDGQEAPSLRSVDLWSTAHPREPHGQWPDGTFISADARMTQGQARRILSVVANHGLFRDGDCYFSPRVPHPAGPAPDGCHPLPAQGPEKPHVMVEVGVSLGDWHRAWAHAWSWDAAVMAVLDGMRDEVDADAAALLDRLRAQVPSR